MFSSVFNSLFTFLLGIVKWLLIALAVVSVPLLFMFGFWCFYYCFIKKRKFPRRKVPRHDLKYTQKRSILKRIYIDFPKRFILDKLECNPDSFDTYGIHIFAGCQGCGKSVAAMHFVKMIKERNPASMVASNIDLDFQDDKIYDWRDILANNNGELGQTIIIDEIQNWFNSMESKNFPPEMLSEITQQRKQRKCIVGTSQVFTRVSKPIREQITYLYLPMTLAGCLTFVRVYNCTLNDDGQVINKKMKRCYFFVHDDELRNCYDTYEKVERLSIKGFLPRGEQLRDNNNAPPQ